MQDLLRWAALAGKGEGPGSRSSHSITAAADGAKLYLFGGEHTARQIINSDLFVYDLAKAEWSVVPAAGASQAPPPRLAHTAAAVGDALFVFGGRAGMDLAETAMDDLWRFDTGSGTWSLEHAGSGGAGPAPAARSFHAMAAIGRQLYVFGGCGKEGRLQDLWRYDLDSRTWAELPAPPAEHVCGRGGSTLVAGPDGRTLHVVGGFCGRELGDHHAFDTAADAWCAAGSCPCQAEALPPRSVFGVHVIAPPSGKALLVAFGGEVDPSDKGHEGAGQFAGDVLLCDPSEPLQWSRVPVSGAQAPCPRGWYASAGPLPAGAPGGMAGGVVVHGGLNVDNERLDDMFVLLAGSSQ